MFCSAALAEALLPFFSNVLNVFAAAVCWNKLRCERMVERMVVGDCNRFTGVVSAFLSF